MSFQQALSGLNGTAKNLDVIGNNIANASTYGTKVARAEFADMFAAAQSSNAVGIGVSLAAVAQQFTQGNIKATDNPMDVGISGGGFFQVTDGKGPTVYTRNGQFKIDRDGYVVNNSQLRLMGYPADGSGVVQPGASSALRLPTGGVAPNVSSEGRIEANLDARLAKTGDVGAPTIEFDDARTLQQRHLDDGVRRERPAGGTDLLLPESRHRCVACVRHRQRHRRGRMHRARQCR